MGDNSVPVYLDMFLKLKTMGVQERRKHTFMPNNVHPNDPLCMGCFLTNIALYFVSL